MPNVCLAPARPVQFRLRVWSKFQLEKAWSIMADEHKKHEITIFVNNQPFKTAEHELTGAGITQIRS